MQIEPFSFREFNGEPAIKGASLSRAFHPHARRKEEAAPPPPPEPTFSEDEVKAAERDAYQKGFLAGIAEGKTQAESEQNIINQQLTQTIESMVAGLAPMFNTYREIMRSHMTELPKIANAIAKKVAGDALSQNAESSVTEIAERCIATMITEPKLMLTVHSSLKSTLEQRLQLVIQAQRSSTEIIVVANDAMPAHDCKIEWKNGAIERNVESLWKQVEQVVDSMVASNTRDAGQICDQLEPQILPSQEIKGE